MPADDPFLFSSVSPLDARAELILRGYPLSQMLFFGSYALAGANALVMLKGLLMTLFYGLLWNHFRRSGVHPISALAIVGALPLLFFRFDELRPQLFSFIFTLLTLQLDRRFPGQGKKREAGKTIPVTAPGHHAALGESSSGLYHRDRDLVCVSLCRMDRPQEQPQSFIR